MNDRIKQLYELAHEQHHSNNMAWEEINHEKFAELIIRDCASICEANGQSYKHSLTPLKAQLAESTSRHCGTLIKNHFGLNDA